MIKMTQKKNEKSLDDLLWLARKIVKAYENNGFVSAVVFGKQGEGKTSYAFKVARDVFYYVYDLKSKDDAWEYVKNAYFFELPDALNKIGEAIAQRQRLPLIVFDDASIWLSKYIWYKDYMKSFYKLFALIRTRVAGVVFTTPSPDDIAKFLREKGWYQIRVTMVNRRKREARAMLYERKFVRNEKGEITTKVEAKAIDFFIASMPNAFYREYLERRFHTEEKLLAEINEILQRQKQENQAETN